MFRKKPSVILQTLLPTLIKSPSNPLVKLPANSIPIQSPHLLFSLWDLGYRYDRVYVAKDSLDRMIRVTKDEPIALDEGSVAPQHKESAIAVDKSANSSPDASQDFSKSSRKLSKLTKRLMQKKLLKERLQKASTEVTPESLQLPQYRKWLRVLLYDMLQKTRTPVHICTETIMKRLANMPSSSGYLAVMKKPEYSYKKLLENAKMRRIVICDRIVDPGNLGTIIRNAVAYEYDAIITTPNSVHAYNDKVIRSSAGAVFKIPVVEGIPMQDIVRDYVRRVNGYTAYIATSDKYERVWDISNDASRFVADLKKTQNRHLLWLSNETEGISNELNELIPRGKGKRASPYYNRIVEVNVDTKMESINVAVASGIVMHKLREYLEVSGKRLDQQREEQRKMGVEMQSSQPSSDHVPFFELDSKKKRLVDKKKLVAGRLPAPKRKAPYQLTVKSNTGKENRAPATAGRFSKAEQMEQRTTERAAREMFVLPKSGAERRRSAGDSDRDRPFKPVAPRGVAAGRRQGGGASDRSRSPKASDRDRSPKRVVPKSGAARRPKSASRVDRL